MRILAKVYVEITTICNLRCSFCPPTQRPAGYLSRERFGIILDRLAGRAKALYFHIKGEPLLHPKLSGLIDDAGAAGFEVRLTTNGTLLPARVGELLGHAALSRINISMHSLEALPPGERRATAGAIVRAAELLAAEPSIKIVSLRFWDSTAPERNLVKLSPTINIHSDERFIWPSLPRGERRGAMLGLADERELAVARGPEEARANADRTAGGPTGAGEGASAGAATAARVADADSSAPPAAADFGPTGFCRALRDQAGILLDGRVVPCCLDAEGDITLGSIYDSPWESIMDSPRARALYRGFSERRVVEPLCRSCGFRTRFGS